MVFIKDVSKAEKINARTTELISTFEQQQAVKDDLDRHANLVREFDLRFNKLRNEIVVQIDLITNRFKNAQDDKSIPREKLDKLSADIKNLNLSLTGIKSSTSKINWFRDRADRFKKKLDEIYSKQSAIASNLEKLRDQEIVLTSQSDSLSNREIFSIKRQLSKIYRLRNTLNKQMTKLINQINMIEKKFQIDFDAFSAYKQNVEDAYKEYLHLNESKSDYQTYKNSDQNISPTVLQPLFSDSGNNTQIHNSLQNFKDKSSEQAKDDSLYNFDNKKSSLPAQNHSSDQQNVGISQHLVLTDQLSENGHFSDSHKEQFEKEIKFNEKKYDENANIFNTSVVQTEEQEKMSTGRDILNNELNYDNSQNYDNYANDLRSNQEKLSNEIDNIDFSVENLKKIRPDFLEHDDNQFNSNGAGGYSDYPLPPSALNQTSDTETQSNTGDAQNMASLPNQADSYKFFQELKYCLNLCQQLFEKSNINQEIVRRFVREFLEISSYFDMSIGYFQEKFSQVVIFKNDVIKLIPEYKKNLGKFSYLNSEVKSQQSKIKEDYNNFQTFCSEFRKQFNENREKILSNFNLFNTFTCDLNNIISWARDNSPENDPVFYIDCNELLESWSNISDRYSSPWNNASITESVLVGTAKKLESKFDSMELAFETIFKQLDNANTSSDCLAGEWDELIVKIEELIESVKLASLAIFNCVQELNAAFHKIINEAGFDTNTATIEKISQTLEFFYGEKSNFENRIKDFKFSFQVIKDSYEKILSKVELPLDGEADLHTMIENIKFNRDYLSNWIQQYQTALGNNLLTLKSFSKKISLDQQRLFSLYNSFIAKYPAVKEHAIFLKNKKRWQNSILTDEFKPLTQFTTKFSEENELLIEPGKKEEKKHDYTNTLKDLKEKNNLFAKKLADFQNKLDQNNNS